MTVAASLLLHTTFDILHRLRYLTSLLIVICRVLGILFASGSPARLSCGIHSPVGGPMWSLRGRHTGFLGFNTVHPTPPGECPNLASRYPFVRLVPRCARSHCIIAYRLDHNYFILMNTLRKYSALWRMTRTCMGCAGRVRRI